MHTHTADPVMFYTQSGAPQGGLAPVASGQAPPAAADQRTLLQKIQMLPAQPYAFGSEAYNKAQATKAERMKKAFGLGFLLGVVAEGVHQYRQPSSP
jgi:hypothetical protein